MDLLTCWKVVTYIGDGGFLRIVRNEDIFSGTHVATGAVGTVTIVIS